MNAPDPVPNGNWSQTDARDDPIVIIDGPGDKTRRPRRPNVPLDYPRPLQPPPKPEQGPKDEPAKE